MFEIVDFSLSGLSKTEIRQTSNMITWLILNQPNTYVDIGIGVACLQVLYASYHFSSRSDSEEIGASLMSACLGAIGWPLLLSWQAAKIYKSLTNKD